MRGSRAGSQDYGRGQKGAVYTALSDLSSTRAADTMTDIYDDVLKSIINRRVYALLNGDMKDKNFAVSNYVRFHIIRPCLKKFREG